MSLLQQVRGRGPALLIVILMHVGLIAGLAAHRLSVQKINTAPIVVQFLETIPDAEEPPPPPPVMIERAVPTMVMPELANLPPAQWEMAATPAVAQSTPTIVQAIDTAPVIQARFDADYLKNPAPSYPPLSRRMREQGTVILRVLVREDGRAGEIGLQRGSGHQRLDQAAMTAVRNWRFVPARRGQNVIESWVLVPIEFTLKA